MLSHDNEVLARNIIVPYEEISAVLEGIHAWEVRNTQSTLSPERDQDATSLRTKNIDP
jgi:hypothetical protein